MKCRDESTAMTDVQNPSLNLAGLADAILTTASDAIIATDRDGLITFWNPGATRIFGYSNDEAMGNTLDIIIPENLRKRHWDGYRNTMATGTSRYGESDLLAVPGMKKDGTRISVEFTIVILRDAQGQTSGTAAILRDVTKHFEETRKLRRQLADATR
jgi:PAS domain S-box-containing protein